LGILKAGGAYVPLDPNYPKQRLAFMLADAQVPVLLTQKILLEGLPEHQAQIVCLETSLGNFSGENPVSEVTPSHLVYVIYTSGSTGKPKGALITHQGLCNLTQAQIKQFLVQSNSRLLQFSSLSFDVAISDIGMAICSGATLELISQDAMRSFSQLIQILNDKSITHLEIPASILGMLPVKKLPQLQTLIVGGEVCSPSVVAQWSKGRRFFNVYGPTEGTVCATVFENTGEISTILPIGRPIANMQTYILDQHLQPVPIGVPGELHIGGAGIARGYLNRPDLTGEKFIPNPFSEKPNSRLYKTGDLVCYLPNGDINYLGRLDNQVKIRGFRIELEEIEAILIQQPDVQEAVVIVREDKLSKSRLVAYLVSNLIPTHIPYQSECLLKYEDHLLPLQTAEICTTGVLLEGSLSFEKGKKISLQLQLPGEEQTYWLKGEVTYSYTSTTGIEFKLSPEEQVLMEKCVTYELENKGFLNFLQYSLRDKLRHALVKKLPDYMVPSDFVLLMSLPLTPNGKIDRQALSKLSTHYQLSEPNFVAPSTPKEKWLAEIWASVLDIERVGIHDNFFELGGHSLQMAQVISKIALALNIKISAKQLLLYPTIAQLATWLDKQEANYSIYPLEKRPIYKDKIIASHFSSHFQLERRSLLSLQAANKIPPVTAAALAYLPNAIFELGDLSREAILEQWFENLPFVAGITETAQERIALLFLPRFNSELYRDMDDIVEVTLDTLEIAGQMGASTVSLTGIIPSATDYGLAITKAMKDCPHLPQITTGHPTTTAAVVLAIEKILHDSGRHIVAERVGVLGLGSIGLSSLRLMLTCLPHPPELILCDLYAKKTSLEAIRKHIVNELGFQGKIQLLFSEVELPKEIYNATLIIGATNAADVLDINQVKSGTLIVDDSGPHCFNPALAIERCQAQQDILFTEGGALKSPQPVQTVIYLPPIMDQILSSQQIEEFIKHLKHNPFEIMGCVFSSVLSSVENIEPTVGLVQLNDSVKHYETLISMGFQAANLHCEDYVLPDEAISHFRENFAHHIPSLSK